MKEPSKAAVQNTATAPAPAAHACAASKLTAADDNDAPRTAAANAFGRLYDITRTLRSQHGCPWDKDQTPLSIRRDLQEEAYEAIDAITANDTEHVREELGDVLFNAVLLAYMYEQQEAFTVTDVLKDIGDKLIRRHPHVFPESAGAVEMTAPVTDSTAVLSQWDRIKEQVEGRVSASILDSVPHGFPPLLKAYKLIAKAEKKQFKWNSAEEAYKKVLEEVGEMREAASEVAALKQAAAPKSEPPKPFTISGGTDALNAAQLHLEEEVGDVLFTFVNYARHLGVDSAVALENANRKFYRRFSHVEKRMAESNIPMDGTHLADEKRFWNEAKALESH